MKIKYYEIPALSNIYFEDSYVLSIHEHKTVFVFELEAVLTEDNPNYETPQVGEIYSYARISLRFINVDSIEWIDRKFMAFADASGDLDYGNIDIFVGCDGGYELAGDWGRVLIKGRAIEVIVEYWR